MMNPFNVLDLKNASVSNREIIQAAALGLREKKYSATEVARAQKLLLDPVSRSCQEFLWFIDLTDPKKKVMEKIVEISKSLKEILDNRSEPEGTKPNPDMQAGTRKNEHQHPSCAQLNFLTVFEQDHDL